MLGTRIIVANFDNCSFCLRQRISELAPIRRQSPATFLHLIYREHGFYYDTSFIKIITSFHQQQKELQKLYFDSINWMKMIKLSLELTDFFFWKHLVKKDIKLE